MNAMFKKIGASIVFLILLSAFLMGIEVVDTGHRGVKTHFGEVIGEPMSEGFYVINPFTENVVEMNVRTQKWKSESIAFTKDVQQATVTFTVNYNLNPAIAHTMFRDVGRNWDEILLPHVVEGTMKEVIGKWEAVQLVEKRDLAAQAAFNDIRTAMAAKGVIITAFEINNVDYSDDFERAVEAKVTAIQTAIQEQNKTVQVTEQAKQQVITAEAQAKSMRIRANALTNNPKLVEYEAVQKWDGKLPQYNLGGATPFINLSK